MPGLIPESAIEEIKARTSLTELVASYGIKVRGSGVSKKASCPFHDEKTPSFNINESKGFYHCFGCGESGDVIKFVRKMDGLTFVEAVKKLAEQCGVKIEEKGDPAAGKRKRLLAVATGLAQFYHRCLLEMKEADAVRRYLKSCKFGNDVQAGFPLGYAPKGMFALKKWAEKSGFTVEEMVDVGVVKQLRSPDDPGCHRLEGCLVVPVCDKAGRVVAFAAGRINEFKKTAKYIHLPKTLIFKESNTLFGFDKAAGNIARSDHHEAIVCNGLEDVIRLHESGFPVAVGSLETGFCDEHAELLRTVAEQVVLAFANNAAGHRETICTARRFLSAGMVVMVATLPRGNTPDTYLLKHSAEDFQKLLDKAESIVSFQARVGKKNEVHPESIDATERIRMAVVETISLSENAVVRDAMVGEAAKHLGLPKEALSAEVDEIRSKTSNLTKDESSNGEEDAQSDQEGCDEARDF